MADLVRMLALDFTNAVDGALGNAEVTADEHLVDFDLDIARTVLAGEAVARIKADAIREAANSVEVAGTEGGRPFWAALHRQADALHPFVPKEAPASIPGFDWLRAGLDSLTIRPQGQGLDVDDSRTQA